MIHDTIKQRLRASLLLSFSAKLTLAQATHFAREIGDDGTWPDLDYSALATSSEPPVHLERTVVLAKARRAAPGMLDAALRRALDLWLSHDFQSGDRQYDQVHVPRLVGQTVLLCENEVLSNGAWEKVIEILARSRLARWVPGPGWLDWSGADLLGVAYNVILRGCLEDTPSLFDAAFGRIFREIRLARPGEAGIQTDMSFHSPGAFRSEGASLAFARECAEFMALAHGTPWQASAESLKIFAAYLLDAQQWMIHDKVADWVPSGTEGAVAAQRVAGLAVAVGQLAQLGNPPRRQELAALSQRLSGRGAPLSGHRYFWRSNLCVHRRPGYYACLHLGGDQSIANSPVLRINPGDEPEPQGFISFSRSRSKPAHSLSPRDWRHLPGMTVLAPPVETFATLAGTQVHGKRFAAGLGEGEYGMAALQLAGENLSGKKAWFFFDESFVCLGSDIQASVRESTVRTVVDEQPFSGSATLWTSRGTVETLSGHSTSVSDTVRRMEHDGFIYDFAGSSPLTLRTDSVAEIVPTDFAPSRLSICIEHGTQPHGGRYAYTVLPVGDDLERQERAAEEISQIEILANSSTIQAVRHHALQLTGIVFWEAGVVLLPHGGRLAANQPCLLLCRVNASGETCLTMSSPTRQQATVHVEYNGKCLCFELPGGTDGGRSVSRQL